MHLQDLELVLKVAEFRSISAAAASLDMRSATASAAIKRVESALGTELFVRSTRKLRLSAAGERYLPHCKQALQLLAQARENMKDDQDSVEGELRIALSSDLGRNLVIPWLDEFMGRHPKLRIRVNISDSNIDFYRDEVDVALRYGIPDDSSLYGFKICTVPKLLCASPDYLAQQGQPMHPHELASHNGLFYQLRGIVHDVWTFSQDGTDYKIKMSGNRVSNDGDLVRRWCVAGKGLALKSCLDMSADLMNGKAVSLLTEFAPDPGELWLVCPSRSSITPAVRLLRDFFREQSTRILKQLSEQGIVHSLELI